MRIWSTVIPTTSLGRSPRLVVVLVVWGDVGRAAPVALAAWVVFFRPFGHLLLHFILLPHAVLHLGLFVHLSSFRRFLRRRQSNLADSRRRPKHQAHAQGEKAKRINADGFI